MSPKRPASSKRSAKCSGAPCWSTWADSARCCCCCCWPLCAGACARCAASPPTLTRVERGEREQLSDDYPLELSRLASNINQFIDSERVHLSRYRNTLADLAHSLKTPLAVMRNELDSGESGEELRWTVLEQVGRMDQIVAYQLSRAAATGHTTFAAPIPIEPLAEEVVTSLEKVYAERRVLCEFDIDSAARFYGEQGDLLELLGNLLENAFKWAQARVLLTARAPPGRAKRRGLVLVIEDDGPGIPQDKVEQMLQRGVRGDRTRAGPRPGSGNRAGPWSRRIAAAWR